MSFSSTPAMTTVLKQNSTGFREPAVLSFTVTSTVKKLNPGQLQILDTKKGQETFAPKLPSDKWNRISLTDSSALAETLKYAVAIMKKKPAQPNIIVTFTGDKPDFSKVQRLLQKQNLLKQHQIFGPANSLAGIFDITKDMKPKPRNSVTLMKPAAVSCIVKQEATVLSNQIPVKVAGTIKITPSSSVPAGTIKIAQVPISKQNSVSTQNPRIVVRTSTGKKLDPDQIQQLLALKQNLLQQKKQIVPTAQTVRGQNVISSVATPLGAAMQQNDTAKQMNQAGVGDAVPAQASSQQTRNASVVAPGRVGMQCNSATMMNPAQYNAVLQYLANSHSATHHNRQEFAPLTYNYQTYPTTQPSFSTPGRGTNYRSQQILQQNPAYINGVNSYKYMGQHMGGNTINNLKMMQAGKVAATVIPTDGFNIQQQFTCNKNGNSLNNQQASKCDFTTVQLKPSQSHIAFKTEILKSSKKSSDTAPDKLESTKEQVTIKSVSIKSPKESDNQNPASSKLKVEETIVLLKQEIPQQGELIISKAKDGKATKKATDEIALVTKAMVHILNKYGAEINIIPKSKL